MSKFIVYRDKAQEYRWTFVSNNGETVADSAEGYTTKAACLNGIAVVKREAPTAPVEDRTVAVASSYSRGY